MPAVNLIRLRLQIEELLSFIETPESFARQIKDLFSRYAHPSLRISDSSRSLSMIPQYHLPDPVLRQLRLDLPSFIQKDIQNALLIADELWKDPYFEVKQMAIFILNLTCVEDPGPVVERIKTWLTPDLDSAVAADLLITGTQNLQVNHPQSWEGLIDSYLVDQNPKMVSFGLQGLTAGVEHGSGSTLPAIYRMISPILQNPSGVFYTKFLDLMEALTRKSPTETAFFLRQTLAISDSPETIRLVKQILPLFPESIQTQIRNQITK